MPFILKHFAIVLFCGLFQTTPQARAQMSERYALIIGGAGGQKEFTEKYFEQTNRLYDLLLDKLGYQPKNIAYLFETVSHDSLKIDAVCTAANIRAALRRLGRTMQAQDQLFIFMTGHGTFDGDWGKFNLVGRDLRDIDYAQLLANLPIKRIIVVNTSSASGPFIKKLSGEQRVIITATKSGRQHYETNFADFFLDALASKQADLDKDNRVSLLEAFKYARGSQDKWFEQNRRLRAEHPLLDDNGDGEGSQDFEDSSDGLLAGRVYLAAVSEEVQETLKNIDSAMASPQDKLILEKHKLQQQIEDLRTRKSQLGEDEYKKQSQELLIRLAKMSQEIKKNQAEAQ